MPKIWLDDILKKKGISRRQFAKLLGKDIANVGRYFKKDYDPKLSTLHLWAQALGVKIRDLIGEDDQQ